jgi:hypothetical protein
MRVSEATTPGKKALQSPWKRLTMPSSTYHEALYYSPRGQTSQNAERPERHLSGQ